MFCSRAQHSDSGVFSIHFAVTIAKKCTQYKTCSYSVHSQLDFFNPKSDIIYWYPP